jgi:ribosomal protein S18 acetylase RimI-like enzyme
MIYRMLNIRSMAYDDLDFAASCTAGERWASEGRAEFEGFFAHDPGGCLVAEEAGRRVGIGMATPYGQSGFIGELIVLPEARGRGVGRALLARAVSYLHGCGARTVLLDGVVRAVPLYERAGFCKLCRSLRFSGTIQGRPAPRVRAMRPDDLEEVFRLDRQAFGADRSFFLARRLARFPELSKVLVQDGRLAGFLLGRRGQVPEGEWTAAGPWVVAPGVEQPEELLESLAPQGGSLRLSVGVLETNAAAVSLVRSLGFTGRQDSPWRMALGEPGNLGDSPLALAVGTAAKG